MTKTAGCHGLALVDNVLSKFASNLHADWRQPVIDFWSCVLEILVIKSLIQTTEQSRKITFKQCGVVWHKRRCTKARLSVVAQKRLQTSEQLKATNAHFLEQDVEWFFCFASSPCARIKQVPMMEHVLNASEVWVQNPCLVSNMKQTCAWCPCCAMQQHVHGKLLS